jgi:hypothetical protein
VLLQSTLFYVARIENIFKYSMLQCYTESSKLDKTFNFVDPRGEILWPNSEGNYDATFKVDLKCRTELAPVELLVELLKEQSYYDNEEESAPGAHREQDPSRDFELKLQIETCGCGNRTTVDRYLIRQSDREIRVPVGEPEKDAVVMYLCKDEI